MLVCGDAGQLLVTIIANGVGLKNSSVQIYPCKGEMAVDRAWGCFLAMSTKV